MPITIDDVRNQHGYDAVDGSESVKGMRFIRFVDSQDEDSETIFYHAVHADTADVNRKPLSRVYARGNLTLAQVAKSGQEVMVDDEKLHYDWEE